MPNIYRVDPEASKAQGWRVRACGGKPASIAAHSMLSGMEGVPRPFMPRKCMAIS